MLLESVYEALQSAGITVEEVIGAEITVFVGEFLKDYMDSLMRDPDTFPPFDPQETDHDVQPNLALLGPPRPQHDGGYGLSCSIGLATPHQACQSLRAGEDEIAIVSYTNFMINPDIFVLMSSLGFLSVDSRSYAFHNRASGYGRGEGIGTIIVKLLRKPLETVT
ncbi:polyketide synthase [Diplodia corticola]|uniref:Polyketide synthase n=1 Tax=Diplodia corticola TaxID=236234 RepID=A0A1J9RUV2_9PEZI|nr:polyketide synthase [Diplodia corticola]OJD32199.1 polyketide synthase [Diplodia corticola]